MGPTSLYQCWSIVALISLKSRMTTMGKSCLSHSAPSGDECINVAHQQRLVRPVAVQSISKRRESEYKLRPLHQSIIKIIFFIVDHEQPSPLWFHLIDSPQNPAPKPLLFELVRSPFPIESMYKITVIAVTRRFPFFSESLIPQRQPFRVFAAPFSLDRVECAVQINCHCPI